MGWGQTGTWGGRRQATEGRSPRSSRATRSRRREARRGIGFPLNRPRTERKGWCYLGHHLATAVALQRNVFGHHGAKAVARRGQSAVRRQPTTDWRDALRQHRSLCEDRLARQGGGYPVWRGAQQSALAIRRLKCRERLTSTPEPCNDRRTICAHHGEPQRLSSGALRGFIAQRPLERWVGALRFTGDAGTTCAGASAECAMRMRETKARPSHATQVAQESALAIRRPRCADEGTRRIRVTRACRPSNSGRPRETTDP